MRGLIPSLLLLLTLQSVLAYAAESDSFSRIGAQIARHTVIRADFVQNKQMAALKRPVVISGHLVLSRRHGLLWHIEKPYRVSYIISEERIVEFSAAGARRERGAREVPGLTQISRVFRAMLEANTQRLRETFDVDVQGDQEKWEIVLKPNQAQLAQFMSSLQLSGGHFVQSIRIYETSGDTTQIKFNNSRGSSEESQAELQFFGAVGKP